MSNKELLALLELKYFDAADTVVLFSHVGSAQKGMLRSDSDNDFYVVLKKPIYHYLQLKSSSMYETKHYAFDNYDVTAVDFGQFFFNVLNSRFDTFAALMAGVEGYTAHNLRRYLSYFVKEQLVVQSLYMSKSYHNKFFSLPDNALRNKALLNTYYYYFLSVWLQETTNTTVFPTFTELVHGGYTTHQVEVDLLFLLTNYLDRNDIVAQWSDAAFVQAHEEFLSVANSQLKNELRTSDTEGRKRELEHVFLLEMLGQNNDY